MRILLFLLLGHAGNDLLEQVQTLLKSLLLGLKGLDLLMSFVEIADEAPVDKKPMT